MKQKGAIFTKKFVFVLLAMLWILASNPAAFAGGLFGPPETISAKAGGLNTAIGYRYHEDTYKNGQEYVFRQNQIYSQVAYGASGLWEIYGRIGISDLKIVDAFSSTDALTTTSKDHFEDNGEFFSTLGAKVFYPVNATFGVGAFVQANYTFTGYTDEVSGNRNGTAYIADLKVKNLWDVHFGVGLQATVPCGLKLYAGPYVYYAEADAHLSGAVPGILSGAGDVLLKNKSVAGGFFGADIPLAKGFRLNVEGQYRDRLSVGSAITYTY